MPIARVTTLTPCPCATKVCVQGGNEGIDLGILGIYIGDYGVTIGVMCENPLLFV